MEPQPSRFAIARAHSSRDRASAKRLEAAWKERDAMLDSGETGGTEGTAGEAEGYPCPHCDEVLPGPPSLAAHVRHQHPRRGRPNGSGRRPRTQQATRGKSKAEIPCPTCGQVLPAAAGWVAGEFEKEGLDEEQAARLAARAWGLLVLR